MRIVFFGSYDADRHPRVRVLVQGLAARGHEVRECNVPLRVGAAFRLRALRHPVLLPLVALRLLGCWARLVPRALRLARPDVVVVGYLGQVDVLLARVLWPGTTLVLDHLAPSVGIARDHAVAGRLRSAVLDALDRWAATVADTVLVDTDEHRAALPASVRGRAVVVPVGAAEEYHRPSGCPDPPPLRAVFVGTFVPLHGAVVIARAVTLLDPRCDVRITMIGTGPDRAAARRVAGGDPRVRWVDRVEPAALPAELGAHHVCLGIFGTTPKAGRVVPTKAFQGAAAGCAVLTGESAPQRRILGAGAVAVPRGDAQALADAIAALAADRRALAAARRRAAVVAERYTPFRTVGPLHEHLVARPVAAAVPRIRRRRAGPGGRG